MSTADTLNSIREHIGDAYTELGRLGIDLTGVNKNIQNIGVKLNTGLTLVTEVKGEGSNVSLSPTSKGGLRLIPLGNCEQTGTPTPDNPIDVKVVTGDNEVVVANKNLCTNAVVYNTTLIRYYVDKPNSKNLTISGKLNVNLNGSLFCNVDNENIGNIGSITGTANTTFSKSFTLTDEVFNKIQNGTDIEFRIYEGGQNFTTISEAMLEVGSTATSYIPHAEQTITLHLGSNYLAGIGDYKDEIVGKTDDWKIKRKVRKLDLAIADMDNMENYPGWTNQTQIVNDLNLTTNTIINNATSFKCNITTNNIIYVNHTDRIWLLKDSWGFTQSQWKEQYPDLIFELCYGIINTEEQTEEPITDTTLITDLNNMYNLMGYDGVVNITTISDSNNARLIVSAATTNTNSDFSDEYMIIRKEAVPQENVAKVLENNY